LAADDFFFPNTFKLVEVAPVETMDEVRGAIGEKARTDERHKAAKSKEARKDFMVGFSDTVSNRDFGAKVITRMAVENKASCRYSYEQHQSRIRHHRQSRHQHQAMRIDFCVRAQKAFQKVRENV
jgi:hypothetical protein